MSLGNTVAEFALYTCPTILHVSKNNPARWLTFDMGHSPLQAFLKPSVKVKMRANSVQHFAIIMAIYHTIVILKGGPLNVSQSNLAWGTVDWILQRWPTICLALLASLSVLRGQSWQCLRLFKALSFSHGLGRHVATEHDCSLSESERESVKCT